jgi:hypothetical protein
MATFMRKMMSNCWGDLSDLPSLMTGITGKWRKVPGMKGEIENDSSFQKMIT